MHDDAEQARRDWRIPDALWARLEPLLPARKPHPLGCHRPRVDDRQAMEAIFVVLRTGCQWHALHETKICSRSSAHRRFQAWVEAEVFVALGAQGFVEDDALQGIDWAWLALDGAMTTAPLGGGKGGQEPHGPRQERYQTPRAHRRPWRADRVGGGRRTSTPTQGLQERQPVASHLFSFPSDTFFPNPCLTFALTGAPFAARPIQRVVSRQHLLAQLFLHTKPPAPIQIAVRLSDWNRTLLKAR